jgi:hypothetical protein
MSSSKSGSIEDKGAERRTYFFTNETVCLYAKLRTAFGIAPFRVARLLAAFLVSYKGCGSIKHRTGYVILRIALPLSLAVLWNRAASTQRQCRWRSVLCVFGELPVPPVSIGALATGGGIT